MRRNTCPKRAMSLHILCWLIRHRRTTFITLTNYRTRIALFQAANANHGDAVTTALSDKDRQQYEKAAEQLLRYMVFANEAPLTGLGFDADAKSDFARTFEAQGIRDGKRRSLRDFDLKTHTFLYPCSYHLIYTGRSIRFRTGEKLPLPPAYKC